MAQLAWGQWHPLGLSSWVEHPIRTVVDPEALVLFSIHIGRHDPRLFDEMLDWLALNGHLLSLQRIKNLLRQDPTEELLVRATLDWAGHHNPGLRSASAATPASAGRGTKLEPIFDLARESRTTASTTDPVFRRWGYARSKVRRSRKSQAPNLATPASLAIRIRLFLGIGSRAEIVRVLLSRPHERVAAQVIADFARYGRRNVNESLTALEDAGIIRRTSHPNLTTYRLDARAWAELLSLDIQDVPTPMDWPSLLSALAALCRWFDHDEHVERSDYLRASSARELVAAIAPSLEATGVHPPDAGAWLGEEYWAPFVRMVEELLRLLASDIRSSSTTPGMASAAPHLANTDARNELANLIASIRERVAAAGLDPAVIDEAIAAAARRPKGRGRNTRGSTS